MTDPTTIQLLWRYMARADQQIAQAAATVPDDAYRRDQQISLGSIEKLLAHCLNAQRVWLARLTGSPMPALNAPPPPRDQVAAAWADVHATLLAFADAQTPATLTRLVAFRNFKGHDFELPVGLLMLHVADHATYHRGQLNSMIKLAGGTPSPVMFYTDAPRDPG